eukprot:2901434-Rhodomonas_salina.1
MVSSCSSEASKPLTLSRSLSRGGSAADLLSELTLGFATWMPIPRSARFMQRQRSDSAESDSSSTTSGSSDNDTRSSSGVSSPTDVSSMSKRIMKEACRSENAVITLWSTLFLCKECSWIQLRC